MTVQHTLGDPYGDSITATHLVNGSVHLRCTEFDGDGTEAITLIDIKPAEFKAWAEAVVRDAER